MRTMPCLVVVRAPEAAISAAISAVVHAVIYSLISRGIHGRRTAKLECSPPPPSYWRCCSWSYRRASDGDVTDPDLAQRSAPRLVTARGSSFEAHRDRLRDRSGNASVREAKTLQPIDTPFGTRLSPMSWEQPVTDVSLLDSPSLAERVGFEPTVRFHAHTLSKRAP